MYKYRKFKTFTLIFLGFLFLLPIGVFAKGTMFIANGVVLNQCTGTTCSYDSAGTTNLRFIGDNTNFEVDHKYTFKLNFSATTSMASPTLIDCGLNINGAYVSPESRNSGRVNYECNQDYSRCDSTYVSTIVYTMPSSLTSVPYFIQCDMTPSATRYTYTNFTMSISDSNGSVIQAIDNNTDRMIEVNNYNANQNNKNRDANSEMIGGKIDNNTNVIGGKLDTHANTISGKLQQIIDNLSNLGSNIISGISSTIESVGNAITNKIGELIGTQEVCTTYYQTNNDTVTYGEPFENARLDSSGNLINIGNRNNFTTPYIPITYGSNANLNYLYRSAPDYYYCLYTTDKRLIRCIMYNNSSNIVDENTITLNLTNQTYFIRYSGRQYYDSVYSTLKGDCHKTGIAVIFNKFSKFVSDFFNINTDGANTGFQGFINDFANSEDYGGLQRVITSPLNMVNNFNSACSPINLTFPHTNNSIQLPCIQTYLSGFVNSAFISLIKLVVNGFICYRCVSQLLLFFHDLKDPHNDEIEVLDL